MPQFNVPHDVEIASFFGEHVTSYFNKQTASINTSAMSGKEFTVQYNISDKKYCLRIKDGKHLEIIDGGIENPMLCMAMGEPDWRDNISGRVEGGLDRFIDPIQILDPGRYRKLVQIQGTLNLRLKKKNGSIMPVDITFNNKSKPSVMLNLKLPIWVAMQKGKKSGQMLFMTGRMKVKGDMMFLMKCQSLM